MRAINVLLSIVVSLVIGLLVFEGGLRLLGMGPPATLTHYDADAGWSNRPDYTQVRTGKDFGPITFEFNSLGLRDDPMSAKKADGVFRVIMLGDSFTLGYTVNREDLFVDLLEDRWQAEHRHVEVLNAGVIGWSTDQQAAWLLANGEQLEPDLVVLLPYDNDVFWCGEDSYTGIPKPKFDASGKLVSGELEDVTGSWSKKTAIGRMLVKSSVPMFETSGGRSVPGDFAILVNDPPALVGDSEARAKGALQALKAECGKLGAELVIAPIPSNASADADFAKKFGQNVLGLSSSEWSADNAIEFYLAAGKTLGIRTVDARAALRAANASEPCYLDFFAKDREWHFNANGNRAFADFLDSELSASLPAGDGTKAPLIAAMDHSSPVDAGGLPGWAKLYLLLWVCLTALYFGNYKDEAVYLPPLKVGLLLAVIFSTFIGVTAGVGYLNTHYPGVGRFVLPILVVGILGFVAYKLGNRLATITELIKAFILRGHWYLMPLVVVLLTIGSLLVVAASSPLVAPFIYTLF